jgi:hypothetical protein
MSLLTFFRVSLCFVLARALDTKNELAMRVIVHVRLETVVVWLCRGEETGAFIDRNSRVDHHPSLKIIASL